MALFRRLVLAILMCVAPVAAPPVAAQCRLCATPTTTAPQSATGDDLRLEIESQLKFDRLIMFGSGDGTAVIRPDGSSSATGAVSGVGPRAAVATIIVHGQPGRAIRVDFPRRIDMFSLAGGHISFDELESDLPSSPRLDSAGNLTFRFGGRIRMSGDADGDYRGDLAVTVEYL